MAIALTAIIDKTVALTADVDGYTDTQIALLEGNPVGLLLLFTYPELP